MPSHRLVPIIFTCAALMLAIAVAQPPGPPPMRRHTSTTAQPLRLVPATQSTRGQSLHRERVEGELRILESNGIPEHRVGAFPNRGNPHSIEFQRYHFEIPANPKAADEVTSLHSGAGLYGPPNRPFGVARNGVLFDPGTAEYWQGNREADWNYEAIGGAVPLGLDVNMAHVQPNGAYHYHGLPTSYLRSLGLSQEQHSPQVGWAADGFPIYALFGYEDPMDPNSPIVELTSSFQLKSGSRPDGRAGPGGKYDGAFVRDYEYVAESGTLDECNGRFCVTPEFPDGTYAYFLTSQWPVVPRNFRGTPVNLRGPGGGPPGGGPPRR